MIPINIKVSESQNQFNVKVKEIDMQYGVTVDSPIITQVYPTYTDVYTVTPSSTQQILSTSNKILTQDIVIGAIPSNYGLITWNGSILRVS